VATSIKVKVTPQNKVMAKAAFNTSVNHRV
jgi:hypothetical protein